jgi:hypothetical protein
MASPSAPSPSLPPTATADGAIPYDKPMAVFGNKPVLEIANLLRQKHCAAEHWHYTPLQLGAYGLDTLLYTVDRVNAFLLDRQGDFTLSTTDVAEVIHTAWCTIYHYWKTSEPWLRTDTQFFPPANGFTARHVYCCETAFWDLDDAEREKDFTLARLLVDMMHASEK